MFRSCSLSPSRSFFGKRSKIFRPQKPASLGQPPLPPSPSGAFQTTLPMVAAHRLHLLGRGKTLFLRTCFIRHRLPAKRSRGLARSLRGRPNRAGVLFPRPASSCCPGTGQQSAGDRVAPDADRLFRSARHRQCRAVPYKSGGKTVGDQAVFRNRKQPISAPS